MADPLNIASALSSLNEIDAICRKLKTATVSAATAKDLKASADRLKVLANGLRDSLDEAGNKAESLADKLSSATPNVGDTTKAINNLSAVVITTDAITSPPSPPVPSGTPADIKAKDTAPPAAAADPAAPKDSNIDLREFFLNVSSSLIDAQAALNRDSLQYVSTLDARFPPAYYGIPSVKAEMRLGFQYVKQKGINLILINSSQTKNNYAESTISFEVVGTPPPPGPTVYGDYVVPVPRFLVLGQKRNELLELLRVKGKLTDKYKTTEPYATVVRYESDRERNPAPGATPPATDDRLTRYLVIWPGLPERENLPMPHTEWTEFSVIYVEEDAAGNLAFPLSPEPTITDPSKFRFPPAKGITIFEAPPIKNFYADGKGTYSDGVFTIPVSTKESLIKRPASDLSSMVLNLGDALMNVLLIFNQWLEDVKYRRPPQA